MDKQKNKRLPAQWESQEFVQLVFPHKDTDWNRYLDEAIDTFVNIAVAIQKFQKCLIVAKNLTYVKSLFKNKNNLTFVTIDSDDTWSRDFGGITIEENNKQIVLNFSFNAWGKKFPYKKDDKITTQLKLKGLLKQYSHKTIPFVLEGGAIDSDGEGVVMTTTKCMMEKNRNPRLTQNTIDKKLKEYLGAQKILWLNSGELVGDDTDSHIDTLARFCPNNIIVYQSCDDKTDEHYEVLKNMEKELHNFTNINGLNYKLVALPWISAKYDGNDRLPATYVNFLIINGAVLVPTYKDKNDEVVLDIFKTIFPKRDVLGIDCTTLIRQHGSLHCVTMQYPKIKDKKV
ncbi:MAG: agmatine deiminase family protein [Campylobacterota bacterium]|nr:agmatine deiminase family protein [Campylobacterota bacterium]